MLHDAFYAHFYLIRHGESVGNPHTEQIGTANDSPLSERGYRQAEAIGSHFQGLKLPWTRLYSSTFPRAYETAKTACRFFSDLPILQSPALVEQSLGQWNGQKRQEIYTPEIRAKMGVKNSLFIPPHGESLRMLERRLSQWLEDEILYNTAFIQAHPSAHIAIFSHGMAIRSLIRYIFQSDPSLTWKIRVLNGSISQMIFTKDGWHPYSLNETAHLKEVGFLPQ